MIPAELSPTRKRIYAAAMRLFAELGVTRVTIGKLAEAAGVARGTIYSHVPNVDELFEAVAARLVQEMMARLDRGIAGVEDPALRMAIGVRQYIRRAHDEPDWGRFMVRFGLSYASLQAVSSSAPDADLRAGIESGRFNIESAQLPAALGMITGSTLAAMFPVLDGRATWREIGADTAQLLLVAFGIPNEEAEALVATDLPALPSLG